MEKSLLLKAAALFDTHEKWEAFLELIPIKDDLISYWYMYGKSCLEMGIELPKEWAVKNHDNFNEHGIQWYLTEFGDRSISIWLEDEFFSIWAEPSIYDVAMIKNKLLENSYNAINDQFDQRNADVYEGYLLRQRGQFEFGTNAYDNRFNKPELAWYAAHQTDTFINNIRLKLEPLLNSTELFIELNQQFKR